MNPPKQQGSPGWVERWIDFCLNNPLVVITLILMTLGWGWMTAPFEWEAFGIERDPVPVDAIPDLGENQQIVFTEWKGRSPQDVEDQVTYPLTVSMLGVPGVKTVRSYSMFGFSSIYVIFDESTEFYWARTRVLEKLNSLGSGALPADAHPSLGPDATALGQVFWYTLEGRDPEGNPTGGWDLNELRSIQDWYVRYGLLAAEGISEVASVGGFVQEYQVNVDPDALRAYGITLKEVVAAVQSANRDVGARTLEINRVEYFVRGLGLIEELKDLENSVIHARDGVPVYLKQIADITLGPAMRRGALDKGGAEVVGGVAVVRYGANPMDAIQNLKSKIEELAPGLPSKTLEDGTKSQVSIVPFYDRTGLIRETLGTLKTALLLEMIVTAIVALALIRKIRGAGLVAGMTPLAVLLTFCVMKATGIQANIVALSGIAIAIGTMVDMAIVICENILCQLEETGEDADLKEVIASATKEVAGAVTTAVATTVISFLPVFTMEAAEGKLFKPLAWTKTIALLASVALALSLIPSLGRWMFRLKKSKPRWIPEILGVWGNRASLIVIGLWLVIELARYWAPLGLDQGLVRNGLFVGLVFGSLIGVSLGFIRIYPHLLRWCLDHALLFLSIPFTLTIFGIMIWLGADTTLRFMPDWTKRSGSYQWLSRQFPGLEKEFMPPLDEGAFLYMPTTMPHASIGESMDAMRKQDMAITAIPEVESAVGKLGRADTALDPAPVSMVETIINYHPKFLSETTGHPKLFKFDPDQEDVFRDLRGNPVPAADGAPYRVQGKYLRDSKGQLISDAKGKPFRLWRPALDPALNPGRIAWKGVQTTDDIWALIVQSAEIPGSTSAPKLQPIAARLVMLQSGMRAPMGVKVKGPDLETIEAFALQIETALKQVPSIQKEAVIADRIVGKPYIEIEIDREAIARYGIRLGDVQDVIETGIGGKRVTETIEGRERYPVQVRYLRELRDNPEALKRILVAAPDGTQIPLEQLASIHFRKGPQNIKSEDTFLVGYVLFDKKEGHSEVEVVEEAKRFLKAQIGAGALEVPDGVSYTFAGSYENQVRSEKKLKIVLPLALLVIFLLLYLHFKSALVTMIVFTGILCAWAGGFWMLWFYGQSWFLDFSILGVSMRELFQVHSMNLSVAVWVGFLALFGIATDDGAIMATYLQSSFQKNPTRTVEEIREAVVEAGKRRVRPCVMTTLTTLMALLPVLTSSGRGSDIMIPMAIPTFGGMTLAALTMFVTPVLFCFLQEKLHGHDTPNDHITDHFIEKQFGS